MENFLTYIPGDSQFRRFLFFSHTPFSRHYRTSIHDTALSFCFFCRCYLLFCLFLYLRLARLFCAYLRGTYLPGLSRNLTLAPSPERSSIPTPIHPPTCSFTLTLFDLCMHKHVDTDTHTHTFIILFFQSRLTVENFILSSLSLDLVTSHVSTFGYLLIMSYSNFILRELPQNLFYIKYKFFFIFPFEEKRIM